MNYLDKTGLTYFWSKLKEKLLGKVDISQGSSNSGKAMIVNSSGNLVATDLPVASSSTVGGIKVGSNLAIIDGVLSGSYATATTSTNGLMSSADKTKLDKLIKIVNSSNTFSEVNEYYKAGSTLFYATDEVRLYQLSDAVEDVGYSFVTANFHTDGKVNFFYANILAESGWQTSYTPIQYNNATTTDRGLMSAADKTKLDGVQAGANAYTLPTASASTLGGIKVGANLNIADGVLSAVDTTYNVATETTNGLMSASDKSKIDNTIKIKYVTTDNTFDEVLEWYNSGYYMIHISDTDSANDIAYILPLTGYQYDNGTEEYFFQFSSAYSRNANDPFSFIYRRSLYKTGGWESTVQEDIISTSDVVNNLNQSSHTARKVLSAYQGYVLDQNKVDKVGGKGLSSNDYTTAEKTKLSGIEDGANKYVHPSYTNKANGLYKVTIDSTGHVCATNAVVKSDITSLGIPAQDTTYSTATTSANGLMSSADKTKLNGVAENANNYSLPTASSTVLGGIKVGANLNISDGVLNATDTTYNDATSSVHGLMSTSDKIKLDGIDNTAITDAEIQTILNS